uniref:Uncharacterized protein n=1 Tax=Arundo donax TaxID=35708 RepID=A0A0A9FBZ8_ARUDO
MNYRKSIELQWVHCLRYLVTF